MADDNGLDDVIEGEVVEDEAPEVEVRPSSEGCAPGEMALVRRESTGLMSPEDLEQDIERRGDEDNRCADDRSGEALGSVRRYLPVEPPRG